MPRNLKGSSAPAKNTKGALADFIRYLGHYRGPVIFAASCAVVAAILNLMGPNKLSDITNLITAGLNSKINLAKIGSIAWILVWLYAGGFVLNSLQSWVMATMTQKMTQKMRTDISNKINRLPLKYFDSHITGDTLSRVTNDVDTVGQSMNQSIGQLVSAAAMLIGSVVMMLVTNWIMALSGILAALLGFALTLLIISKSQTYFLGQQQELGQVNGTVEETYSSLEIVKAYNAQKQAKKTFDQQNERLYNFAWKSQFLSQMMMPLMQFVGNLAYVVVCIVGAVLAKNGVISFGVIVAFMIYIRLFTQPLQTVAQALSSLQQMAAACERVFEFLDEDEMSDESNKTKQLTTVEGHVDFEHVKFSYDPGRVIIHDFSENIKPGQKIAIVGPTGAGKTTLVNLLMRFYEVDDGSMSIDGVSTKDLTRANVHELFGMVLQDTWLFAGTLRENLVYNQPNVTDATLDKVCAATGLTDLVEQLPHGYDTMLDDNADLSAGQRQLITIARAMIKDAPLSILDEATSSVDTRTELKVQQAMDTLMKGRTSFVIAHRLSTIKNADKILVVNNGDVVESGNHEELMAKNGFYAQLYNSQFEPA
jgi:ATP-binding cassette subfamily B protein